jgi:two-component system NarL family sensor kinase
MKRLVIILLLLSNACFAQPAKTIDSLIALARLSFYNDYNKTIALSNQIIKLSRQSNNLPNEATGYNIRGVGFQFKGDLDSALLAFNNSLAISRKLTDPVMSGKANANLGSTYFRMGKYDRSISYGYEALRYFEKAKDTASIARVTGDIANTFIMQARFDKAVESLKRAIVFAQKAGDAVSTGNFYNSLSIAYNGLKKWPEAEAASQKALEIAKANNNLKGQLSAIVNIAERSFNRKLTMNIAQLLQAEKIATELEDKQRLGEINTLFAKHYRGIGNYNQALKYITRAIGFEESAKEYDGLEEALKEQVTIYRALNRYDKAYNVQVRISQNRDSVYNEKSAKQQHDAEVKYETEKKQKQIQLLNKQAIIQQLSISSRNKTIGIIVGLFVLVVVFAGLFYSRNKLKQKAAMQAQMLEQQEVLTRAVIEAEEKERQRIASDLHDGVGQLFSAVKMNMNGLFDRIEIKREEDKFLVEKTMALVDESCKEVRSISHQMMPNNMLLRSGIASDVKSFIEKIDSDQLKVNLEANGFKNRIESNVEVVLYRVIQECVNNVIKHAKATRLDIILDRTPAGITVLVKDNGLGFNTALRETFDGIGLKNIETRIEYLKGKVTYTSAPGQGTEVNIMVPVA